MGEYALGVNRLVGEGETRVKRGEAAGNDVGMRGTLICSGIGGTYLVGGVATWLYATAVRGPGLAFE
jgi:hypothetical protein